MKKQLLSASALVVTIAIVSLTENTALARDIPLRLGLGVTSSSAVFGKAKSTTGIIPVARLENKWLSAKGSNLDVKLVRKVNLNSGVGLNLDSAYLDRNETPAAQAWKDLSPRVNIHTYLQHTLSDVFDWRLRVSRDISGESDGTTADLAVYARLRLGQRILIRPGLGLQWLDKRTFDYLFAGPGDASQDVLNPFLSAEVVVPLSRRWAVSGTATAAKLDSAVERLPQIEASWRYSGLVSVTYQLR